MTEIEKILDRVRNLLQLSEANGNENEAAAAAAAAQKLIERFKLDAAMLDASAEDQPAEEEIRDCEDPLDRSKSKIAWKGYLADGISLANGTRIYWNRGNIQIVGAASNVATVRYLYAHFVQEIDRMAKRYSGNGKSWMHAWRVGCAETISSRLTAAREEARNDAIRESQDPLQTADQRGVALVRINNSIAKLDGQDAKVGKFLKDHLRLKRTRKTTTISSGGYAQGKVDGANVSLSASGVGGLARTA